MRDFLAVGGEPHRAGTLDYRNVFRLLVVEFIDAHNFDLRSVRKTCVHIVHPDGERVIPFDTYNMFYRDDLEQTVLAPIRAEREDVGGPLSVLGRRKEAARE